MAERFIAEYKKFLIIAFTTFKKVAPPKAVEVVWKMHMCYTKHYRNFIATHFPLVDECISPAYYDSDEQDLNTLKKDYTYSKVFYKNLFSVHAPQDVWESITNRTKEDRFYSNSVNMYSLCIIQTYLDIYPAGIGFEDTKRRRPSFYKNKDDYEINKELREWRINIAHKPDIDQIKKNRDNRFIAGITAGDIDISFDEAIMDEAFNGAPADEPELEDPSEELLKDELVAQVAEDGLVDPVLAYGALKFIGNDCDENFINVQDFGDALEDGIYDEFIYQKGDMDRDILDIVEMGDGGLDLINDGDKEPEEKIELGLESRFANLGVDENIVFDEVEEPMKGAHEAYVKEVEAEHAQRV